MTKEVIGHDRRMIKFRSGINYFTIENPTVVREMLIHIGYNRIDKDGYYTFKIKNNLFNLIESIDLGKINVENSSTLNQPKDVILYSNKDGSSYMKFFTESNITNSYVEYKIHPFLMDLLDILRDYFIKVF